MSPWVHEIAFLSLAFIHTTQPFSSFYLYTRSLLISPSPPNAIMLVQVLQLSFVFWPLLLQRKHLRSRDFHDFTDNLFVVYFSLSTHIFLHLCFLKMVRIFFDVVTFHWLAWNVASPLLDLWSLLLLTAIIAISSLLIEHFIAHLFGHLTRETLGMLVYIQFVSDPDNIFN